MRQGRPFANDNRAITTKASNVTLRECKKLPPTQMVQKKQTSRSMIRQTQRHTLLRILPLMNTFPFSGTIHLIQLRFGLDRKLPSHNINSTGKGSPNNILHFFKAVCFLFAKQVFLHYISVNTVTKATGY